MSTAGRPRPKLLQLSTVHPLDDTRIMYRTALPLAVSGNDVVVIGRAPAVGFLPPAQVRTQELGPIPRRPARRLLRATRVLRDNCRAEQFDVIHIHDPELVVAAGVVKLEAAFRRESLPVIVFDAHEMLAEQMELKPLLARFPLTGVLARTVGRLWPRVVGAIADRVVVAEPEIQSWMSPAVDSILVRNTVDLALYNSLNFDQPQGSSVRIIYVGSASDERGILDLISAMSYTDLKLPIDLFIVGSGTLTQGQLEEAAARVSHDDVKVYILGRQPNLKAAELMASADIGVIPFRDYEKYRISTPTKAWEYLAAGLAIVGSDLPPIRRVLAQKPHTALSRPGEPRALAQAITELARSLPDPELRRHEVRESFRDDESHSADRENLLSLYQDLHST